MYEFIIFLLALVKKNIYVSNMTASTTSPKDNSLLSNLTLAPRFKFVNLLQPFFIVQQFS